MQLLHQTSWNVVDVLQYAFEVDMCKLFFIKNVCLFYICAFELHMCKLLVVTYVYMFYICAVKLHMCKLSIVTYLCLIYICASELHMCKLFTVIPYLNYKITILYILLFQCPNIIK
ncbi:hypothetical protein Hanom_Chr07g00653591 [Helianthus anomalus]